MNINALQCNYQCMRWFIVHFFTVEGDKMVSNLPMRAQCTAP